MSALCVLLLVGLATLCGCGPSDGELLEQAIAAITADQELTAEGWWHSGGESRQLTSAELDTLRVRLTAVTLKAGRDRTWDPPTSEWGAILHTADGGRVELNFWNETDAEMGWYSLALPSGQISTSGRSLVLEAPQVAGWLRETLEASGVTADGEERPTPRAVDWISPQAAAEKVVYQLWWAGESFEGGPLRGAYVGEDGSVSMEYSTRGSGRPKDGDVWYEIHSNTPPTYDQESKEAFEEETVDLER